MSFLRALLSDVKKMNTNVFFWGFPLAAGFGWFVWDAIDEEFLVSLNLATDPEESNRRVESARLARLEALKTPKPVILKSPVVKDAPAPVGVVEEDEPEEDEEEAPVEDKEETPAEDEEEDKEEPPADEEEVTEDAPVEDGDDEAGEDEDEDEESEVVIKPLYDPVKGKKLGKNEIWDNFTIKALNMGEDDDDDDEEEEEEEEEVAEE